MTAIRYALFFMADVVLIGCLVSFIYMGLSNPVRFALCFDVTTRPQKIDYRYYAWSLACLVGIGIFIYHGVAFLFSWIPRSWGRYGEFTAPESLSAVAGLCAFFGSLAIMSGLTTAAHNFNDLEIKNDALRHSFDHLKKQIEQLEQSFASSPGHPAKTLSQILDELEEETVALQRRPFVRDRFKENPLPLIFRPSHPDDHRKAKCSYWIDAEPSLRLIKMMRHMAQAPGR